MARYGVRSPSNIRVEWCSAKTDLSADPPKGGIYLHPQFLALGLKLLLTDVVGEILSYFQVAPSQLTAVAWRIVLDFEALCALFAPNSCRHKDFCAIYSLRKTSQDSRVFISRGDCDRLIVNLWIVTPSSGFSGLEWPLLPRAVVLFQPHGKGAQSRRGARQSRRSSKRWFGDCSRLTMIFTIGVGY